MIFETMEHYLKLILDISSQWSSEERDKNVGSLVRKLGELGITRYTWTICPKAMFEKNNDLFIVWRDRTTTIDNDDIEDFKQGGDKLINNYPNALFIINDDPNKLKEIRLKKGVLCVSWGELDGLFKELSQFKYLHSSDEAKGLSWNSCKFPCDDYLVSNSLLIVDKYYFSSSPDAKWDSILDGLVNQIKIFFNSKFERQYHIWILFDPTTFKVLYDGSEVMRKNAKQIRDEICEVKEREKNDKSSKISVSDSELAKGYNKIGGYYNKKEYPKHIEEVVSYIEEAVKNKVKKEFSAEIEIKCIPIRDESSQIFHDRRIFSAYGQIQAAHFLNRLNKEQDIFVMNLFAGCCRCNKEERFSIPFLQQYHQLSKLRLEIGEPIDNVELPLFHETPDCIKKVYLKVKDVNGNYAYGAEPAVNSQEGTNYKVELGDKELNEGDVIRIIKSVPDESSKGKKGRFVKRQSWEMAVPVEKES